MPWGRGGDERGALANGRDSCSPGTTFRAEMGFSLQTANGGSRLEEGRDAIKATALEKIQYWSRQNWENACM